MARIDAGRPLLRGEDYYNVVHFANPGHREDIRPRWAWCEELHGEIIGLGNPDTKAPATCLMCIALERTRESSKHR